MIGFPAKGHKHCKYPKKADYQQPDPADQRFRITNPVDLNHYDCHQGQVDVFPGRTGDYVPKYDDHRGQEQQADQ